MSINYIVKIEEFANSHYIKKFSKKYKNFWDITLKGILLELERFEEFTKTDHLDFISGRDNVSIFKADFRVAGTNFSRKASGNRYIIALDNNKNEIKILLMYHKNDIGDRNETSSWKNIIKDNYSDYDFLK